MPLRRPHAIGKAKLEDMPVIGQTEDIAVYQIRSHGRSAAICEAAAEGLSAAGFRPHFMFEDEYHRPLFRRAFFYGYIGNLPRIMHEYPTVVFCDLGYWHRKRVGRYNGYHKLCVNDRHPGDYFMNDPINESRLKALGVGIAPWRTEGSHILVAGMSAKAAKAAGIKPGQWERQAIEQIREYTGRKIIYRPKPNCRFSAGIPGIEEDRSKRPIAEALKDCHALVTYHSNSAVDALMHGVPVYCEGGAAKPLSMPTLADIADPPLPGDRRRWASALACAQWDLAEMRTATPWNHLVRQGVL